ncbi:hypothetical protein EUGRSUZ_J00679 [Eucalyptus grandis]|uniref:Uncharacterized protein n=2 Tax=Eucalyptus grandis TaxID=71139 RepID=A0ACC3J5E8_EUCGR|nr:hypothetical protein EUGRSUZ_J00679 [Eucalyptus grandis]
MVGKTSRMVKRENNMREMGCFRKSGSPLTNPQTGKFLSSSSSSNPKFPQTLCVFFLLGKTTNSLWTNRRNRLQRKRGRERA